MPRLFQVAIDLPGYGRTREETPVEGMLSSDLLQARGRPRRRGAACDGAPPSELLLARGRLQNWARSAAMRP